jgi:hypothetical protein
MQCFSKDAVQPKLPFKIATAKVLMLLCSRPGTGPFEPVTLEPEQCNTEACNIIHLGYWESWSMGRGSECNGFPIDMVDVDTFGA